MNKGLKVARFLSRNAVNIILIFIFLAPFYWMLLTAIKTAGEVFQMPPKFYTDEIQWSNFVEAFTSIDFLHYAKNSAIMTLGTLAGQVLVVIPAAYAFARYEFHGKKFFFGLVLATLMIPGQLIVLPIFIMYVKIGLINKMITLIIPFVASGLAIFLLRQTFMQVPDAVLEAARLDNASEFKIIYTIMMPMAYPTIVTIGLFTFINTWNNYLYPLVWTTNDDIRTLMIGIQQLQSAESLNPQVVMAGNMLIVVPIIIVFIFARKQIVRAFSYTGIK